MRPDAHQGSSGLGRRFTRWLLAALVLAAGWAGTAVAAADKADPIGLPKPISGLPLTGGAAPSVWFSLRHSPPLDPGSMLLMSDGTVLVHQDDTRVWKQLIPDRHGSYIDGGWRSVAPLPTGYRPQYFASAVLPDGRLVVVGGEYDGTGAQAETNRGAVFDPVRGTWRPLAAPPGWREVGDAQSTVLADGRLLLADLAGSDAALLDPTTLTWSATGAGKRDDNDEEGFTLLPDGRVLTLDTAGQQSELLDPATGVWSQAAHVPVQLVDNQDEQGPLVSGPDGDVFAVGATGRTAIYHPVPAGPGSWTSGPRLPKVDGSQMVAADAAGARLPNGDVVLDASPPGQVAPAHFFRWNGRRITALPDTDTSNQVSAYDTRMVVLPTGQILLDDSVGMYVFTGRGRTPRASWRPVVGLAPSRVQLGRTYSLSGAQLAGRDQGAAYGDDFQDDTNYPLVRLVSSRSGFVSYARTFNWTTDSTAPRATSSVRFRVSRSAPLGRARLEVVANGIASRAVDVTVTR